ncbi:MAG: methyltransferase domain-containing protein [Vicingus serpentipes]|nr:methyltransferase domain-containing protein [Vicingus serpentipes]
MNNTTSKDTQEVKSFFDGYANDFDSIYGHTDHQRGILDKLADKLFRQVMLLRFKETLKRTANSAIHSVMDIGCGPGHYCVEFLKQGKKVMAIDLAENMLKIAKGRVNETHLDGKGEIAFLQANYLEHNFEQQYDAACLMGFFDYIKNPEDVLEKLKKDITKEVYASFPQSGGLLIWQRKIRYKMRNCPLYLYSLKDLQELMKKVGLEGKYEVIDLKRDFFVKIDMS